MSLEVEFSSAISQGSHRQDEAGRLQRPRLLCRARALSHAHATSESSEKERCSRRQPGLATSLTEPQQRALAMLSPPGKDPGQSQAGS